MHRLLGTGDLGPAGIAGITIGAVAVAGALAVTVFFCYYVHNKQKRAEGSYGSPAGMHTFALKRNAILLAEY